MKGVIFTELMGFIEARHGVAVADQVILDSAVPNDGAYTSVGSYPTHEALALIDAAARLEGVPGALLCQDYGSWLFGRFGVLFPTIMAHYPTADALLLHVGSHIHEEVRILYPDARPPMIEAVATGDTMTVRYRSHRPMAHIAFGLVRACLAAYGDKRELRWSPTAGATEAMFTIAPGVMEPSR